MKIHILLLLALAYLPSLSRAEALRECSEPYSQLAREVQLASHEFDAITQRLSQTLSGNLATVLRSEWKAKGTFQDANRYIEDLTGSFLTPETRREATAGLDPLQEGYIRKVAERLYLLEKAGKIRPGDKLFVRDPPAPPGASDSTFTYYTRAVRDSLGGKHQVRARNYVRQLDLESMKPGQPVEGFTSQGGLVKVERLAGSGEPAFSLTKKVADRDVHETLTATQLRSLYGDPPAFFAAPHGKKFKLEIKTRLKDEIASGPYTHLGGKNLVQKLDVSLTPAQTAKLFGQPSPSPSERLRSVKQELLAAPEADPQRIEAVFGLLEKASAKDPDFLRFEGATRYTRSAFEIVVPDRVAGKTVRIQTTVDRDLTAHQNLYRADGALQSPGEALTGSTQLSPADPIEQRHWELKIPKPLVAKAVGVRNYEEVGPVIEIDDNPVSAETKAVLERFSLCEVTNRGKFLHICEQKPLGDRRKP